MPVAVVNRHKRRRRLVVLLTAFLAVTWLLWPPLAAVRPAPYVPQYRDATLAPYVEWTPQFSRVLTVVATAYTAGYESTGKRPGHPAFGITRSGLPVEVGHIAVDPRIIPLLSYVWVEGLCDFSRQFSGRYKATDTGGAIKGKRIDIYFERVEDATNFGVRRMRVYVFAQ